MTSLWVPGQDETSDSVGHDSSGGSSSSNQGNATTAAMITVSKGRWHYIAIHLELGVTD
jgi:hypothetical protein